MGSCYTFININKPVLDLLEKPLPQLSLPEQISRSFYQDQSNATVLPRELVCVPCPMKI